MKWTILLLLIAAGLPSRSHAKEPCIPGLDPGCNRQPPQTKQPPTSPPATPSASHTLLVCPLHLSNDIYFSIIIEHELSMGWFKENKCYEFPTTAAKDARVFIASESYWSGSYGLIAQTGPVGWGSACGKGSGGEFGSLETLFSWNNDNNCQSGFVKIPYTQVFVPGQTERFSVQWK